MKGIANSKSGFTLVEIVISVLLTAVMAAAVLSIALTATRGSGRSDRKTMCAQLTRQVSGQLKNFVTAYYDYNTLAWNGTRPVPAPNGATGTTDWAWAAYTGADGAAISDSLGGYALAATAAGCNPPAADKATDISNGCHVLTNGIVPAWFQAAPYNAYVAYSVTKPGTDVSGGANGTLMAPQVKVVCNWTEP